MRLAVAAIALTMIAGCAKDRQQVTDPSLSGVRFGRHGGGVVGGTSHRVNACIDVTSSLGTYNFSAVLNASSNPLELPTSIDPDYAWPHTTGPYIPGDVITAAVSVTPGNCSPVFQRNETLDDANNRLWDLPEGIWNPEGTVDVTFHPPFGYVYSVLCTSDDPSFPLNCGGDQVTLSADIYNGSGVTVKLTSAADLIAALRIIVTDLELRKGTVKHLDEKLAKAQKALAKDQIDKACKELAHFISDVTGDTGKKIEGPDAENLVAKASEIQLALDC